MLIDKIKEYFYIPQIGDIYYRDIKPSYLFDPWECEKIRKQEILVEDTKTGWVKFSYGDRVRFSEKMPINKFKRKYTRKV